MSARRPSPAQRGAALLSAMLTVALVATLAAAGLWQQWRAVEVEGAERTRMQASWILTGALDWGRLILIEDAKSGGVDHLGEPWALPLQEARLSSFLAADRQAAPEGSVVDEAFLSGSITDLQSRLNVNDLVEDGKPSEAGLRAFQRLFDVLGLPPTELEALQSNLLRSRAAGARDPLAPLPALRMADLERLGLSPRTLQALAPHATLLPAKTTVNLNTASAQAIFAVIPGIGLADAQRMVTARQSAHFRNLSDALKLLDEGQGAVETPLAATASQFFEIRGRVRLDRAIVEERSVVQRQNTSVRTLWREASASTAPPR
ncbi:type II secretion system minor pseudopilin GspK [Ramlibacter sp. MAHUQ-53]|uniref:type II secretion system minor pseudopilin GspK n=1 Tax=unclassified Ramlibacter TaxID=2617605 RepID=UPI00362B361F